MPGYEIYVLISSRSVCQPVTTVWGPIIILFFNANYSQKCLCKEKGWIIQLALNTSSWHKIRNVVDLQCTVDIGTLVLVFYQLNSIDNISMLLVLYLYSI